MFVDGKAATHERELILAHLAECRECRGVVFFMQNAEEKPIAAGGVGKWRMWRAWMFPAGLAGAALACGLTILVVSSRTHRGPGEIAQDHRNMPAPGLHTQAAAPQEAGKPGNSAVNAGGQTGTSTPAKKTPRVALGLEAANTLQPMTAPAPAVAAPVIVPNLQATVPHPEPGSTPDSVDKSASANAKGEAPGRPAAAGPNVAMAAKPESEAKSLPKPGPPAGLSEKPSLRIEHDRGPEEGMSEVSGRVTDPTGAVVAGAVISLRDGEGKTRDATSAADGTFSVAGIQPGRYELKVTAQGFETSKQTLDLKSRDVAMLDSVLRVGAATETVTVESNAAALDTESASVSSRPVAELPSHLPAETTVSLGKRMLSLDTAGNLYLSRNRGKSWKKVKPQWTGAVAELALTGTSSDEDLKKTKAASAEKVPARFQLTTDDGAQWISGDGTHWRTP